MIKKTIDYTDYNGVQRSEDFYFNLNRAEMTEMDLSHDGGITKLVEKIVRAQDWKKIVEIFKDLVLRAYGEKSADGRRFIKNDEVRDAFAQTEAYSALFMELATDADAATEFINGIVPHTQSEKVVQHPGLKS